VWKASREERKEEVMSDTEFDAEHMLDRAELFTSFDAYNPMHRAPLWIQERYWEDRAAEYQRLKNAQAALDILQAGGVVNTPDLFWSAASGETLVDAIKRIHQERLWHR
jgi:hypothetical protein